MSVRGVGYGGVAGKEMACVETGLVGVKIDGERPVISKFYFIRIFFVFIC